MILAEDCSVRGIKRKERRRKEGWKEGRRDAAGQKVWFTSRGGKNTNRVTPYYMCVGPRYCEIVTNVLFNTQFRDRSELDETKFQLFSNFKLINWVV